MRPELLARAFSKMEELSLGGTELTMDQLNCLFAGLASDNKSTQKTRQDLQERMSSETDVALKAICRLT